MPAVVIMVVMAVIVVASVMVVSRLMSLKKSSHGRGSECEFVASKPRRRKAFSDCRWRPIDLIDKR